MTENQTIKSEKILKNHERGHQKQDNMLKEIQYHDLYNNPDYVYKNEWKNSGKKKNHTILKPVLLNDSIFLKSIDYVRGGGDLSSS